MYELRKRKSWTLSRDSQPWVWCKCRTSFACYDCFHESQRNNIPLCATCLTYTYRKLCLCGADEDIKAAGRSNFCPYCGNIQDCSDTEDSADEDATIVDRCDYCLGTFGCTETEDEAHIVSHREKIRWYVDTVDWNSSSAGFYETLGIDPESTLGSLVRILASDRDVSQYKVFSLLDQILDEELVRTLNSKKSEIDPEVLKKLLSVPSATRSR
jgi:hypothetical protein